ncbi:hypothetical protein IIB34_06320 [PVC group bacterium]|nr:hypothetical protein [PVC group bacterium]
MKSIGGYSYLNTMFIFLVFIEAIVNQPYTFILRNVNIQRFQYLQMTTDIIAISFILYYMGGVEAPLVTIAYYAVILWAGVVSTVNAAFFAVALSSLFYSGIVLCEHYSIFPSIEYFDYNMPTEQMFSLLIGNVSFMFAFGYFTTRSSIMIKTLEKKRQEESIKHLHKLTASGYLIGNTSHDILNCLASIRGYTDILLETKANALSEDVKDILQTVLRLELKSTNLLTQLAKFAQIPEKGNEYVHVKEIVEDALNLLWPIMRYQNIIIEKKYDNNAPKLLCDRNQIQEAFVAIILTSYSSIREGDRIIIENKYDQKEHKTHITFTDQGPGFTPQELQKLKNNTYLVIDEEEKLQIGMGIVYEVIQRHKGEFSLESVQGKGTTYHIVLPVVLEPASMVK